jgi:uncharacterized protein YuzE
LTLDSQADAAYLYLAEGPLVARTIPVVDALPWMVNLDLDSDGKLVGIEILDASARLPRELLDLVGDKPEVGLEPTA